MRLQNIKRKTKTRKIIDNRPKLKTQLGKNFAPIIAEVLEELLVNEVRQNAPQGPTGDLRDSIEVRKKSPVEVRLVVGAFYGFFIEFGTKFQSARPFFRPAIDKKSHLIDRLVSKKIDVSSNKIT